MPNINGGVLDGVRRIGGRFRDLIIDGGLPGAPLGYRLRGATLSGPPKTGTWRTGDIVPDRNGVIWTCVAGGTPGTWAASVAVIMPSADQSGAMTAAAINAAVAVLPASGGTVMLGPGLFYVKAGQIVINRSGVTLRGAGGWATFVQGVGTGDVFRMYDSSTYGTRTIQGGGILGLTIDGTGMGAGSSGIHAGDIFRLQIDATAQNFTGAGSIGVHFDNAYYFTEQGRFDIYAQGNTSGVVFDCTAVGGGATGSFDRCELDLYIDQQNATYDGVVFQNGAILIDGVKLGIKGNFASSGSVLTSAVLRITGSTPAGAALASNSQITNTYFDIGVECPSGTHAPQTIVFGSASNTILASSGQMDFGAAGVTFAASNNNGNLWFDGPVYGDTSLLSKIASAPVTYLVNSGFPTGWAGAISFRAPRADGLVFAQITLNTTSGTVMNSGTTIATGLPSWATPTDTRYVPCDINGTYCSFAVTASGHVVFTGPTQTSGGDFPYGQTWYTNSA